MSDYTLIPLKGIKPDPNQPRKTYADPSFDELVNSVREKGIIQPIIVRPHGKGYMVICGERRLRAAIAVSATIKDRDMIPAVIREASDEEALELQLIENAVRSDVHPMEEAAAFLKLSDNLSYDHISLKTGKSVYYIRQRIALNNLDPKWQKAFKMGAITVELALKIAALSKESQLKLYEEDDDVNEQMFGVPGYQITFNDWNLRELRAELSAAPFDIYNDNLTKGAPACTVCQYNSSCAQLFPDASAALCSNIECYKEKVEANFKLKMKEAAESPDIIYVVDSYGADIAKLTKKLGVERILDRHSVDFIDEPKQPFYNEWLEDEGIDNFSTKEEIAGAWQNQLNEYEAEKKQYIDEIASGKLKPALIVNDGQTKGKLTYVKLAKKANVSGTKTTKATAAKEEEGTITVADIDAEINRIKEREERSMKTDEHKIWAAIQPHFNPRSFVPLIKGELSPLELEAAATAIYQEMGYAGHDDFRKHFKLKSGKNMFTGISMDTLLQMIRFFYLSVIPPTPTSLQNGFNDMALLSLRIADEFFPSVIKDIRENQGAIAAKRAGKAADRILELQNKKAELKKAAKKSTPSPKKKPTKK